MFTLTQPSAVMTSRLGSVCFWVRPAPSSDSNGILYYGADDLGDGFGSQRELHLFVRQVTRETILVCVCVCTLSKWDQLSCSPLIARSHYHSSSPLPNCVLCARQHSSLRTRQHLRQQMAVHNPNSLTLTADFFLFAPPLVLSLVGRHVCATWNRADQRASVYLDGGVSVGGATTTKTSQLISDFTFSQRHRFGTQSYKIRLIKEGYLFN